MSEPTSVLSIIALRETITPSSTGGVIQAGDIVTFTLAMSSAVTVTGGTPTFTLNDGGIAVYDAAATAAFGDSTKLVFSYKVAASDLSVDGLSFVRGDQNGSIIIDSTGRGPDFTGVFTTPFSGIRVDTPPTTVTSVVASPSNGVEHVGDTVTFTVTMSRGVTVTGGALTFTLNNGGIAVFDASATAALGDPSKMVLSYTVGASDLPLDGLSFVRGDQNGSVIVDGMGLGPDFSGVFAASFSAIHVDTPPTTVTSVTASPSNGVAHAGDTVVFTVTMSRAVTVTGDGLTFTLNDGGVAVYDAAATEALGDPTKMVFSYTVGATDLPMSGLSFVRGDQNGSVIVDGMGRGPDFSGVFAASFSALQVATTAPGVHAAGPQFPLGDFSFSIYPAPMAALTNGNFVVVGGNAGSARIFSPDGAPVSAPATLPFQPGVKVTGLANGGFAVAGVHQTYNSSVFPTQHYDTIEVQLFDSTGAPTGAPLQVSPRTTHPQSVYLGDISKLTNGGFVVEWGYSSPTGEISLQNSRAIQIFAADGTKVGSEITVDSGAWGVAGLADGNFVVVQTHQLVPEMTAQIFDASGNKVGSEFRLASQPPNGGAGASIAALPTGGFVIAWESYEAGFAHPLWVQQFAADGTKIGLQFRLDRPDSGFSPFYPKVAALADGNFVVTWRENNAAKAQVFDAYQQQPAGPAYGLGVSFGDRVQVAALPDGGFVVNGYDSLGRITIAKTYAPDIAVTAIAAGTTLDIPGTSTAKLAFAPGGATLQLDNSDAFAGSITGFGDGDRIDLADIAFSGAGTTLGYTANASNSGGHLTVSDGTHIASLTLLGQYAATSFVLTSDGHGGTLVSAAQDAANQSQLAAHT
ncbi:hypothetical protein [Bradyrhizobium sp. CB2312]|uniref:hypothetical protein n=1 Tax=Bradyrhizobium sp. CB2312 TaxID=3039155 RepID=UPI0024B1D77F|nr:hypothetical protein [Bradyrhizobium sp. CB2312]WFU69349.1 hypothetical protein QA642_29205 [Bradyrhizobium sp. CB2312]